MFSCFAFPPLYNPAVLQWGDMTGSFLKEKTVSGVTWTAIDQFSNQGIQFIIAILIARVLSPADYGVIAIVVTFIGIASTIVQSGFSQALVQRKEISHETCSSVFFFNMTMSVGLYIVAYLCAPFIADFFAMPLLTPLFRVLGLIIITDAFAVIHITLLNRDINFKKQTLVNVFSVIVSGSVGLYLAYTDFGVWALVGQSLARSVTASVVYWGINAWRPLWHYARKDIADLWGYSSKLLASGLLNSLFSNLQTILIGKFYTAIDLGFYSQGRRFPSFIAPNLTTIVQRVTFPALATIQEDTPRLRAVYRRIVTVVVFLIFPVMLILAAVAHPFIEVLLTAKWLPAVPYLQVICFAMLLWPLHAINVNISMVRGRTDIFLKLEIIKKVIGVVLMVGAIPLGVLAIAFSELVHSIICFFFNAKYNGDLIEYPFWAQVKDIFPAFALASLSAFLAWSMGYIPMPSVLLGLILQLTVGVVVYLILCRFFKLAAYTEVLVIVGEQIRRLVAR